MTTELATRPTVSMSLQLSTLVEVRDFCKVLAGTGMVPKPYQGKPDDILVAILHGQEVGLPHLQALQSIAVVNGIPSIYGDAALAMVRSSGKLEDFDEWIEVDGVRQEGPFPIISLAEQDKVIVAFCMSKRVGASRARTTTFSVDDAKRAGLWGKAGTWTTVPQRMLMWRARGWNLRDNFGDVLKGLSLYEEALDIPMAPSQDGTYRAAVEIIDPMKDAAELAEMQAKLREQKEAAAKEQTIDAEAKQPPEKASTPPAETAKQASQAPAAESGDIKPFGPGPIAEADWKAAIAQIASIPTWAVLIAEWKALRKCKNELRMVPAGQQNLLMYLREKIGPAFPY